MITCGFWFCDSFIPVSFSNVQLRNDRGQALYAKRKYPRKARGANDKRRLRKPNYLISYHLMPKPIARSKTRKAVAKRFKITARSKVLRAHPSCRHLLSKQH